MGNEQGSLSGCGDAAGVGCVARAAAPGPPDATGRRNEPRHRPTGTRLRRQPKPRVLIWSMRFRYMFIMT